MVRPSVPLAAPARRAATEAAPAARRAGRAAVARAPTRTLTEQLAGALRRAHRASACSRPGARLPSVRECARRHAVSPRTVVAAYDQLLAHGLVEARPQRGFFVREPRRAGAAARAEPRAGARRAQPLPNSATALIRGMFQPPGAQPMPGLGTLPAEWLDPPMLAGALRKATSSRQVAARRALQYGDPAGDARLRDALAIKLADHGIAAHAGADRHHRRRHPRARHRHPHPAARRRQRAGRRARLVGRVRAAGRARHARAAGAARQRRPRPRGDAPPDRGAAAGERPRLYVTVSVLHNPTGASLVAARRAPGAEARRTRTTCTSSRTTPTRTSRRRTRRAWPRSTRCERTIYVSGFSKILTPNWRVGFLAAPPSLVDRFVDTKLLSTLTTPGAGEQALAHCLEQGSLRRHAERVMQRLDAARARTVRLAEAHGCRFAAGRAACSAGSMSASTPSGWRRRCSTTGCSRPAACSTRRRGRRR